MLPCNHHRTCVFSYVHKGKRLKYCLACLIDKVGLQTIDEQRKGLEKKPKILTKGEIEKIAEKETAKERMARVRLGKS